MVARLVWFAALLSFCLPLVAYAGDPLDLQYRYRQYHVSYELNADGTGTETRKMELVVLKEPAIEWAKRSHVTYSTSAQKAEILLAYTQKADGRRIDASKDNYQIETNTGREQGAPAYSDWTTVSVVFPDVAVGDTVVFSYRVDLVEPLFPGHFTVAESFYRQVAYEDVQVRIDYPVSLWVQFDGRGMGQKVHERENGRKLVEWSYSNPQPLRSPRRDFSVFDPEQEAGYAFSTFRNYAGIVAAYGARALPKAAVTERIKKLADLIVKDGMSPKSQARALYDWVATNITYAGNCIGVGAVVPRDLSYVLDNKMGDCKDQATLLQALLAARGIQSTQALVNSGSIYRLPKIPVVSMVNHVINYIPALDLYVDPTAKSIPFGMLPMQDSDKPVLLVEGYRDGMRTPPTPQGSHQQKMVSKLKLLGSGSITGTVEVFQKGYNAAATREMARKMTKDAEVDFVKDMFRSMGMIGFGKLEKDDPSELTDSYRYKASIELERFANMPGAGAFYIYPLIANSSSIYDFLRSALEPELEADVACENGSSVEEYTIELPRKMKVLSIPDNLKVANDFLSYNASYRLKGNILTVSRMLEDRTQGNVCAPAVFLEYRMFAEKVIDNLKAQVLYK